MTFNSILRMGLIVLSFACVSTQSFAQENGAPSQGTLKPLISVVLDLDEVLANSVAMKGIREQLSKYQAELQKKSNDELKVIQASEDELQRKRTLLAPEAFAEERKKFQATFEDYQRRAQESTMKLNTVRAEAMSQVSKVVQDIVTEAVKANGIAVVYHKKATYLVNSALDMTKPVYDELNKRLPSVQVKNPNTVTK